MKKDPANLELGPGVLEILLPQRRPMRMVDFVRRFNAAPVPELESGRYISVNEPFFEGHFDRVPIWPGVLTIEGLGQSCTVLMIVTLMVRAAEADGEDPEIALEAFRNADRASRLHPGFDPDLFAKFLDRLETFKNRLAVGAAVDVKFLQPVFPGCRLDYHVRWTADLGQMVRFDVEASRDGIPVLTGTMTGAQLRLRETIRP